MKVVINTCFGLSTEAHEWLIANRGWRVTKYIDKKEDKTAQLVLSGNAEVYGKYWDDVGRNDRTNKDVIDVVEALDDRANSKFAKLKIVKIPNNIEYKIMEYDGLESIHESHRSWN